jgi:hypothetical protein
VRENVFNRPACIMRFPFLWHTPGLPYASESFWLHSQVPPSAWILVKLQFGTNEKRVLFVNVIEKLSSLSLSRLLLIKHCSHTRMEFSHSQNGSFISRYLCILSFSLIRTHGLKNLMKISCFFLFSLTHSSKGCCCCCCKIHISMMMTQLH